MIAEPAAAADLRPSVPGFWLQVRVQWRLLLLAFLVLLAAAARMVNVAGTPAGFFTDEASYGMNSYLILTTGRDEFGGFLPIFFKAFGEYKLPLFIYAEIPFLAVFGRTEAAVRLAAAFFGSLTVVTTYLLAKELFRRELPALASAAALAVMPWHIHYSRTGFGEVVMLPLLFTSAFALFFRSMRDARCIIPACVALAFTFYAYRPAWVTMPLLLLVMLVVYRSEIRANLRLWAIGGAVFSLILLPIPEHLFLSGSSDRSSQASIFTIESEKSTFELFVQFYRSYFTEDFLFSKGDNAFLLRHYLPGHGQLYYLQAPLLLAGIVAMLLGRNRRTLFVLLLLLAYPLSAALSDFSPISTRAILGTVPLALLSGAGLWALITLMTRLAPARTMVLSSAIVVVFAAGGLYSFGRYTDLYHSRYAALSDGYWGWQAGPQEIIAYFQKLQPYYDDLFIEGVFNAPDIFIPFYAGDECGHCRIGGFDHYQPERRQLFAVRPQTLYTEEFSFRVLDHTLYYTDGSAAFLFVEIEGRR